jgi:hypothetical protein
MLSNDIVEVLAPPAGGSTSTPTPRRVRLHRGRVVGIGGEGEYLVFGKEGTICVRADELVDWATYPAQLASSASSPVTDGGPSESIAIWRCEMFGEVRAVGRSCPVLHRSRADSLMHCITGAVLVLVLGARLPRTRVSFRHNIWTRPRVAERGSKHTTQRRSDGRWFAPWLSRPDRLMIDWTNDRLLFHGGKGAAANAWDSFFEAPPPPKAALHGGSDDRRLPPADLAARIERAAAAGTLGVTTVWGPPYFCKLGNFRGGEPRGFVPRLQGGGGGDGDVPGGRQDAYDDDDDDDPMVSRSTPSAGCLPRQLDEHLWGGPLDATTIDEGREALARWVVVRPYLRERAAAHLDALCAARLPMEQWVAVHVRQTDKMREGRVWHFGVAALAAQVCERAAGLRCSGAFLASDDPDLKAQLGERLRAAGLLVASIDATLSSTPGAAAHKDPSIDRHANAQDCLVEVLMMAACRGIVCTLSNVSTAAVFFSSPGYRHYLFTQSAHASWEELDDSELSMC